MQCNWHDMIILFIAFQRKHGDHVAAIPYDTLYVHLGWSSSEAGSSLPCLSLFDTYLGTNILWNELPRKFITLRAGAVFLIFVFVYFPLAMQSHRSLCSLYQSFGHYRTITMLFDSFCCFFLGSKLTSFSSFSYARLSQSSSIWTCLILVAGNS